MEKDRKADRDNADKKENADESQLGNLAEINLHEIESELSDGEEGVEFEIVDELSESSIMNNTAEVETDSGTQDDRQDQDRAENDEAGGTDSAEKPIEIQTEDGELAEEEKLDGSGSGAIEPIMVENRKPEQKDNQGEEDEKDFLEVDIRHDIWKELKMMKSEIIAALTLEIKRQKKEEQGGQSQ